MIKKNLSLILPLAGLFLLCMPVKGAEPVKPSQKVVVEIVFEKPENFTDIKDSSLGSDKGREAIMADLREYVAKQAAVYLPAGQGLKITFTDIDLAGDYEPWRTNAHDVRIVKDIYPPRFDFGYQVLDANGALVKEGKERLRDLSFMSRLVIDRSDSLRFEKSMLDDWMRANLRPAKK